MKTVKFIKSASHWNQFPKNQKVQIAFVGRSNSGKSSFINALGNPKIAKVSGNPGKTSLLNIFDFEAKFWIVDMPGYGYARRSHKEQKNWKKMIEGYLSNSPMLKGLILFIDIRRQWSEAESQIVELSNSLNKKILVVLTKADKLSHLQQKKKIMEFNQSCLKIQKTINKKKIETSKSPNREKDLTYSCFAVSSVKKRGVKEVIDYILKNWINQSMDDP